MNSLRWMMFLIISSACGLSCSSSRGPTAGTNPNWLEHCSADAECDDGAACLCGTCTHACSKSAQCGDVSAEASCQPFDEATCGKSAEGSACLVECKSDGDCAAVEDGRCQSGQCVRAAVSRMDASIGGPDAGSDGAVEACNDGTGDADCCTQGVASGEPCSVADLQCWTRCSPQNSRSQFVCSDGNWLAGKGLFPCGAGSDVPATAFVDGLYELRIDRVWNGDAKNIDLPTPPLEESSYAPDKTGYLYRLKVENSRALVTLADVSSLPTAATEPVRATFKEMLGERLMYDLPDAFAGGRFVVWATADGLQGEYTTYGSGVPIATSQRGPIVSAMMCTPGRQSTPGQPGDPCPQNNPICSPPLLMAVTTCGPDGQWKTVHGADCDCVPSN